MINWKTSIGLSLFLLAFVELLKIKDYYHPDKLNDSLVFFVFAFLASVITATILLLYGLRGLRFRRNRR